MVEVAGDASNSGLSVVGLFAGIGGIELGMHAAGHRTEMVCEIDRDAQAILRRHFPDIPLEPDVTKLKAVPRVDAWVAGFPCQDLSQAGRTAGIAGEKSGLVRKVFELLDDSKRPPTWLVLENVPFMLQLDRGQAMKYLTTELGDRGYSWAYRVVDARAFGLPQRRLRVLLVASRTEDPRSVVLSQDRGAPTGSLDPDTVACGFYWTEGLRGLGWAVDAVPTLKGGSSVGIASPPAIRLPLSRAIVVPEIRDAERLQGLDPDWTAGPASAPPRKLGVRWKLVGNAVSVPVSTWLGEQLANPGEYLSSAEGEEIDGTKWPLAAWGRKGTARSVHVSSWPERRRYRHLHTFLRYPKAALSQRAAAGFLSRAESSSLRFPDGLIDDVRGHLQTFRQTRGATA